MNIDRFSLMGDAQAEAERASPEAVVLRRQLLEFADVPRSLKDVPITFIIASLMSLAFLGFSGFKI